MTIEWKGFDKFLKIFFLADYPDNTYTLYFSASIFRQPYSSQLKRFFL